MAGLGVFGAFVTMLVFAWREQQDIEIPTADVERVDRAYRAELAR
jgi:cytochrome o ubiquinol oxidase subunit 1